MKSKKTIASALALLILGTAFLSSGVYFCLRPQRYRATCRVRPNRNIPSALAQTNVNYDPYFIQTEFELMKSEVILDKVISALDLNAAWAQIPGDSEKPKTSRTRVVLRRQLEVRLIPGTGLIGISISGDDGVEAAKIANTIAETYRDYRLTRRKERALTAVRTEEAELQEVNGKIKKLEEDLARNPPTETEPAVELAAPVAPQESAPTEAETEYLKEDRLMTELNSMSTEDLRQTISGVAADDTLSRLQQDRTAAENQLIALGQDVDAADADVQRATDAVAALDTQIDERVQLILQGMRARVAALKAAVETAAVKVEETKVGITDRPAETNNSASRQKIRLGYQLRELKKTRDVLEMRVAELPVALKAQVEIVDRAEPPAQPVFPNHALGAFFLIGAIVFDGAGLRLLKRNSGNKASPSIA